MTSPNKKNTSVKRSGLPAKAPSEHAAMTWRQSPDQWEQPPILSKVKVILIHSIQHRMAQVVNTPDVQHGGTSLNRTYAMRWWASNHQTPQSSLTKFRKRISLSTK